MAFRTSATEVKQINDGCTLSDPIVDAYITAANLVITEVFSNDTTTSTAILAEIERWYAAHIIASTVWRAPAREKVGDAEIEYGSKVEYVGEGYDRLSATTYGQTAMQLDPTGKMNSIGKRAATIYAIKSFDE